MEIKKLSIVIPAYNEGKTIRLILDRIKSIQLKSNIAKEIIIVNDCSTDDTEEAIQRYMQIVCVHRGSQGWLISSPPYSFGTLLPIRRTEATPHWRELG